MFCIWKVEHLNSLWKRGLRQFGNGLFKAKYLDLPNLGLKWGLIELMKMRGYTMNYSKRKAKNAHERRNCYSERVNPLQAGRNQGTPHTTKTSYMRQKVRFLEEKWDDTRTVSKTQSTSIAKRSYTNRTVTRLKIADNMYTEDQFKILEKKKKCFYESLYKSKNVYSKCLPFFNPDNITP